VDGLNAIGGDALNFHWAYTVAGIAKSRPQ
jgi:hypothetical protein